MSADEVQRVRGLLAAAVRLQALPLSELALRVGMGRGQLARLLNGRTEIRLSQLLRVLAAIDLPPGTFFRQAFPDESLPARDPRAETQPDDPPAPLLDRLHDLIGLPPRRPGTGPRAITPPLPLAPISDAELDQRLDAAFERFWGAGGKAGGRQPGGSYRSSDSAGSAGDRRGSSEPDERE
jgi:transcriptional regulator with XRE-family HTH domain